jgi:predicted DNA-binding transcriptional regulator AlpA
MGTRRTGSRSDAVAAEAVQMTLAIDTAPGAAPPPIRRRRASERNNLHLDPILYMSDVVRIVGRHRSTILRWIDLKRFPAKSVPHDHPTGWLRSDIERWQYGDRTENNREPLSFDRRIDESTRQPRPRK